jgi:hypothetical protein
MAFNTTLTDMLNLLYMIVKPVIGYESAMLPYPGKVTVTLTVKSLNCADAETPSAHVGLWALADPVTDAAPANTIPTDVLFSPVQSPYIIPGTAKQPLAVISPVKLRVIVNPTL